MLFKTVCTNPLLLLWLLSNAQTHFGCMLQTVCLLQCCCGCCCGCCPSSCKEPAFAVLLLLLLLLLHMPSLQANSGVACCRPPKSGRSLTQQAFATILMCTGLPPCMLAQWSSRYCYSALVTCHTYVTDTCLLSATYMLWQDIKYID